jgi:hypothetical protein
LDEIIQHLAHWCRVAAHSRRRIGVRVAGHLLPPVAGDGPAVEFRSADLAVHVGRDLSVMLRAERARYLDLHGLCSRERMIQAGALARQRLVPLIDLVRQENSLGLTVRPEGNRLRRSAFTAKARENA